MDDAELLELGRISIASPCSEDWESMTGDDRARSCAKCQLTVYDLSALTALEARDLIAQKEGQVCVRFFKRADGTVLTRDCPVAVATSRRRGVLAGVAVAVGAVGALVALAPSVQSALRDEPSVQDFPFVPLAGPVPPPSPKPPPQAPAPPPDERWMEARRGRFTHEPSRAIMGRISVPRIDTVPETK